MRTRATREPLGAIFIRTLSGVVVACLCGVPAAIAQDRPYRSLFGGAANDPMARQALGASVSLGEGYDTDVLSDQTTSTPRGRQLGGSFTSLSADARYVLRGKRAELTANAGTNLRYFTALHEVAALRHSFGVGASLPMGEKTTAVINQAVSYTPSYLFGLFAKVLSPALGEAVPTATDYGVTDRRSYTSSTSGRISRSVSRRGTLDFAGGYRRTTFTGQAALASNLTTYNAGSHLGYRVGRDATLRLGYDFRQAEYGTGRRPAQHDIGLGVDYDRPLSRSRRTRLGFNFGSSLLEGPSPLQPGDSAKQLRAVGNVLLTHQIGRTWSARAAYRRGAQFVEDLSAPVFTDGLTLMADGFLNRRTDVTTSIAYTAGDFVGRADSAFETYTASTRVRVGVTQSVAASAEYLYYFYDFHRGAQLVSNIPSRVGRNGVRVGLTFWIPIIRN
jgi:hypothetical protein